MSLLQTDRRRQAGVGLLEVLIALLIIAIGALGYAGLQLTALRNSGDAADRAHAAMIAQDAIERIKSNPAMSDYYADPDNWPASANGSAGSPEDWKVCRDAVCTAEEMADWDIKQLVWAASTSLLGGRVMATDCDFGSLGCVVVSWDEQAPALCLSEDGINTADDSQCLVMEIQR
ncbi:hypothetical protein GCM10007421_04540 [Halopseudomonas oceani]|uniref:Type IV pilus modification protein PilV n=1 Tax=Halopseudomonas oceani TaxID=1708783 RepID=A0A2P4EY85_9GAMM|nr:type IV pilus modification protein PilV [Halopseudomonas oceani]POB05183.1 type IV pilus modification protein PilV [Halopseudomonas oceani]GGE33812.1 hypothetical protein GCM10007421_04540 [Halopseudomonas oceani]